MAQDKTVVFEDKYSDELVKKMETWQASFLIPVTVTKTSMSHACDKAGNMTLTLYYREGASKEKKT
jgi:hypothetical protein